VAKKRWIDVQEKAINDLAESNQQLIKITQKEAQGKEKITLKLRML
jgi:hypothetical protein